MSVDYSIKAYPTIFNGVRYRSRLEARWAAFFDGLGWKHKYEPYDLGAWSPDFLVSSSNLSRSFLVDVKPLQSCCDETIAKMQRGMKECSLLCEENSINGALLTRVAPEVLSDESCELVSVGWHIDHHYGGLGDVGIGWFMGVETDPTDDDAVMPPMMIPDLAHVEQIEPGPNLRFYSIMDGDADPGFPRWLRPYRAYRSYTMGLWNAACNAVQWRGKDST